MDDGELLPPPDLLTRICLKLSIDKDEPTPRLDEAVLMHCLDLWRRINPEEQWLDTKRNACDNLIWSGHYHNADTKLSLSEPLNSSERSALLELIRQKFLNKANGYCYVDLQKKQQLYGKRKIIKTKSLLENSFDMWCLHMVMHIGKIPDELVLTPNWQHLVLLEETECLKFKDLPLDIQMDHLKYLARYKHLVGVILMIKTFQWRDPKQWIIIVVRHFTPTQIQTIFRSSFSDAVSPREHEIIAWDTIHNHHDLIVPYVMCLYNTRSPVVSSKLLSSLDFKRLWRLVYKFDHPILLNTVVMILCNRNSVSSIIKERVWHLIQYWYGTCTPCVRLQDILTSNFEAPWSFWDIELLHFIRPYILSPISIDNLNLIVSCFPLLFLWLIHRWNPPIVHDPLIMDDPITMDCYDHYQKKILERRRTIESCLAPSFSSFVINQICLRLF